MTTTNRPPRHRLRLVAVLITVITVIAAAIVYVVVQIPSYRTEFLLDTSARPSPGAGTGSDFNTIAAAVGSAAQNAGDGDALSLRRFGGSCGDPRNTAQVVGSGTNRARQVADATRTLTPGGAATLQSGILAAIDDFSGFYPFRGTKSNRIVVVTGHGIDACSSDQAALMRTIQDRVAAAGLRLDFRFVGYKIAPEKKQTLTQVAVASGAPEPTFAETAAELTATLKQLTIPESPEAAPVKIPDPSTRVITVVPVDSSVNPLPGYRVTPLSGEVECGSPQSYSSPSAVGANIVSCSPSAASADVCWTRPDRVTVLCGIFPWEKELYQYTTSEPVSPVSADRDPLPWGLELEDGTKCRLRNGGAWGSPWDDLAPAYGCSEVDALYVSFAEDAQVIDKSLPTWTVQFGPLDPSAAPPRPTTMRVAVAYFAGSPS